MHLHSFAATLAAVSLAQHATCQFIPVHPHERTMDVLVVDSSFDGVWRMIDWNQDGDFNDANEALAYYSDTIGSVTLATPTCIVTSYDGTTYVGDANVDLILAMRDDNGDGDANDAGEHRVFFDNSNAGGLVMASIGGITVDRLDRVFASVANSSAGTDVIYLLEDLNGDGDANDTGEASAYCNIPGSTGGTGDSIPVDILIGPDLNVYYVDIGVNGPITKGVYRLEDLNFDGDCNDAGEVQPFWLPISASGNNQFFFGLAVDHAGAWYLSDHGSDEKVLRGFDANANGVIEPSEETLFYQTSASTWWDIVVRDDGSLLLCEDQTPDRITWLRDNNGDNDALDPGESRQVYDDTVAQNGSVRPRGASMMRAPLLGAQPATVQIGNPTTFVASTNKPAELAAVFLAIGPAAPMSVAPFGIVAIDATQFISLGFGVSDGSGNFSQAFTVPNNPAAVGTLAAQALCGDGARLFLSNAALLTVTP